MRPTYYMYLQYSYIARIAMAIQSATDKKITLNGSSWNGFLTTEKVAKDGKIPSVTIWADCLFKVPQEKGRPGKGPFWTLDPACSNMFEAGNYRRRKRKPRMIHPASTHPETVQHHQQSQLNRREDKFVFSIENILRPDPLPDKREQITPLPLVSFYTGQIINHRFVNSLTLVRLVISIDRKN
jgi:hypothetical protein